MEFKYNINPSGVSHNSIAYWKELHYGFRRLGLEKLSFQTHILEIISLGTKADFKKHIYKLELKDQSSQTSHLVFKIIETVLNK